MSSLLLVALCALCVLCGLFMSFLTLLIHALLTAWSTRLDVKRKAGLRDRSPAFRAFVCVGYGLGCAVRGSLAGGSLRAGWLLVEPELDEPELEARGVAVGVVVPPEEDGV